jgi:TPR repeat protein
MGAAGLADSSGDGLVQWPEMKSYLRSEVAGAARRDSGREQVPEIDDAPIVLQASLPVPGVARGVEAARDEASWRRAEQDGSRAAFEAYVGGCRDVCAFREQAMARLFEGRRRDATVIDRENWSRLSAERKYRAYLDGCGEVCAFRSLAEAYLGGSGQASAAADPRGARCDDLASDPDDPDKPAGLRGVKLGRIETGIAIEACRAASQAQPGTRRFSYYLGRAFDRADRYREAFAAYKLAADAGSRGAMNNLATLHENGQGTKKSMPEAMRLYVKAAEAGNPVAMANAGRLLQYGNGVPKDEAAAVRWYKRAVDAGDVPSISKLVPHYTTGAFGFPRDPRQGFDLFRRAADKGDPVAMATVATLIDNGFAGYFPGVSSADVALRALKRGEAGAASVAATDTAQQKLKPQTIRALQQAIKQAEYYSGAIDGRFNPVFVRAMDVYAKANETE